MQRLFNVSKWRRLVEGGSMKFDIPRARVVRLELNSRAEVGLYLLDMETGEALFLSRSVGRDTVEFHCGGSFNLVSDGEIFIYTADGEQIHHEVVDPVIFTRITERRQINPEILAIQRMMNLNIERRLAEQRNEFNDRIRQLQRDRALAARAAAAEAAKPADESVSASDTPKSASDDGADAGQPAEAGGGRRKAGR